MIYLIFTLFDIYFTAKTDMEPRQGGRFHIWHMLTRKMPFCNLCASKDGTFERENCAPKRPARFRGLDLASAISSAPETITRPFLTAARMYILAKPVSLWTRNCIQQKFGYSCKDSKLRNSSKNRRRTFSFSRCSRNPRDSIALSKIE